MKVIEVKDYQEMSNLAAKMILVRLQQGNLHTLGLATGGTPVGTYQELIKAYQAGLASFRQVNTVNLDEYIGLSAEHEQSYHKFMQENLFDHIDIPLTQTHVPDGMAEDLEAECSRYDALIEQLAGIDLQLVGIGVNGHVGFNEPGTPFDLTTHVTSLTEATRLANARFFGNLAEVPTKAITMGMGTIMSSKEIIMLISGKSKAEIVARLLTEPIHEEIPASILKNHPNATVIIDQEALSIWNSN